MNGLEVALAAWRGRVATTSDIEALAARLKPQINGNGVKATEDDVVEPELDLVAHLAPLLPKRIAVDIGANVGKYSEALLDAGFEVHAFEPNPAVLEKLRARLGGQKGFAAHGIAVGSGDGKVPLHLIRDVSAEHWFGDASLFSTLGNHALPEGLEYADSIEVPVRTLGSLHREGVVPTEVSYVKVDTEGFDLEVVLGMDSQRYPVVSVEFWDKNLPFGKGAARNALGELTNELQRRGYGWWVVLYKVWGDNETVRFYCNTAKTIDQSWGNAFFFQDKNLFDAAELWCESALPRTDFSVKKRRDEARVQAPRVP
jgi:FkbM family methyltransferase